MEVCNSIKFRVRATFCLCKVPFMSIVSVGMVNVDLSFGVLGANLQFRSQLSFGIPKVWKCTFVKLLYGFCMGLVFTVFYNIIMRHGISNLLLCVSDMASSSPSISSSLTELLDG